MALFTCFFASTWMLVVPSGTIGFISEAFPLESSKSIWIAAAVTIPNCVLQSFIGDISDHLGRKGLLLGGMLLGIAGTLITSKAKNMNMVIGGQALSGCSVTIGYLAIPLANELVPKNQRPKIQALIGIFAGLANCTGVIVAGAFIKHSGGGAENGWRAAFYLGAGFFAVTFAALLAFYHPSARLNPENLSLSSKLRDMDWLGIFLVGAGLTIFLVGLEFGGNPYKWSSARVLAPLIVGGACLVGFGVWEAFGTKTGLLAHGFFVHPNYAIVLLLNFVGGMVLFGGQAFLPREIIYLFTQDAVLTGVYNLPFNICGVLGGIIAGIVVQLTKESKHILIISFVILVTASGLMAVMQPHINFAAWFFPTGLLGITVGVQIALLPLVASIGTPNHLIAQALGVVASTRAFGGSIGVIIFRYVQHLQVAEAWFLLIQI
jgi:MFS family permease